MSAVRTVRKAKDGRRPRDFIVRYESVEFGTVEGRNSSEFHAERDARGRAFLRIASRRKDLQSELVSLLKCEQELFARVWDEIRNPPGP